MRVSSWKSICLKLEKRADTQVGCRLEGQIAQIEAGSVLEAVDSKRKLTGSHLNWPELLRYDSGISD